MNLEATWQCYLDAINERDWTEARHALESLMRWFDKGCIEVRNINRKSVRAAYAKLRILLADRHR